MSTANPSENCRKVVDITFSNYEESITCGEDAVYQSNGGVKSVTKSRFQRCRDARSPSTELKRLQKNGAVWRSCGGVSSVHRIHKTDFPTSELPTIASFTGRKEVVEEPLKICQKADEGSIESAFDQSRRGSKTSNMLSNISERNESLDPVFPQAERRGEFQVDAPPLEVQGMILADLYPGIRLSRGMLNEINFEPTTSRVSRPFSSRHIEPSELRTSSLENIADCEPSTWAVQSPIDRIDFEPSISRTSSPINEIDFDPHILRIREPPVGTDSRLSISRRLGRLDGMNSELSSPKLNPSLGRTNLDGRVPRLFNTNPESGYSPIVIEDDSDHGLQTAKLLTKETSALLYAPRKRSHSNAFDTLTVDEPKESNNDQRITNVSYPKSESNEPQSSKTSDYPLKASRSTSLIDKLHQVAAERSRMACTSNNQSLRKRKRPSSESESSISDSPSEYTDESTRCSTELSDYDTQSGQASIKYRKHAFIYNPSSELVLSMKSHVREMYDLFEEGLPLDGCWLYPHLQGSRADHGHGATHWRFHWKDGHDHHHLSVNFGLVALLIGDMLTEEHKQ